jgi:copper chaperone
MEIEIQNMTCRHCAVTITKAILSTDSRAKINVDLSTKAVRIEGVRNEIDLVSAIVDAGYNPSSIVSYL